jgi:hypothetical protein
MVAPRHEQAGSFTCAHQTTYTSRMGASTRSSTMTEQSSTMTEQKAEITLTPSGSGMAFIYGSFSIPVLQDPEKLDQLLDLLDLPEGKAVRVTVTVQLL